MKAIQRIDQATYGLLLAGAINSALTGITKKSLLQKAARRKSPIVNLYYGLLGAATAYKFLRTIGPKTKEEQRLIKLAKLYDKAETYQRRASLYRRAAETLFKRRWKNFQTIANSK